MRLRQHSQDQANKDIHRDDAGTQQPSNSNETDDAGDPSQHTDEGPLDLKAICRKALRMADVIAVRPSAVTPAHPLDNGTEGGTSYECINCRSHFRQYDQLQEHVHNYHAEESSATPDSNEADALLEGRMEERFRRPRAIRPKRLLEIQSTGLLPDDEGSIRRDEADGERYYFARHVGIEFLDGPQDGESKLSASSTPVSSANLRNFGRVEEPKNRPSHYHRNWISKKDLCDRKQMGRGMYKGYSVHVHDQVYFMDAAGNKMWLVDDEGQAVLFQDQRL